MLTKIKRYYLKKYWLFDFIISLILFAWIVFAQIADPQYFGNFLRDNGQQIYIAATASYTALLGFVVTTTTVLINASTDEHLKFLVASRQFNRVIEDFLYASKMLAVSALCSFVFLFKPDCLANFAVSILLFSITVLRMARCLEIMEIVVRLQARRIHKKRRDEILSMGSRPADDQSTTVTTENDER